MSHHYDEDLKRANIFLGYSKWDFDSAEGDINTIPLSLAEPSSQPLLWPTSSQKSLQGWSGNEEPGMTEGVKNVSVQTLKATAKRAVHEQLLKYRPQGLSQPGKVTQQQGTLDSLIPSYLNRLSEEGCHGLRHPVWVWRKMTRSKYLRMVSLGGLGSSGPFLAGVDEPQLALHIKKLSG